MKYQELKVGGIYVVTEEDCWWWPDNEFDAQWTGGSCGLPLGTKFLVLPRPDKWQGAQIRISCWGQTGTIREAILLDNCEVAEF